MKKFTYPLSDNDIQTLMDALAVMVNVIPGSDLFPPETIDLALFYSEQIVETFSSHNTNISRNMLQTLYMALTVADGIISGDIPADEESKKICQNSVFGILKLLPVFDEYFGA